MESEDETAAVGVAYAVGRRVGSAVVRNRWRRRLRAIAGEVVDTLPPGAYLIGLAPAVNNLGFAKVKDQVMNAIEQVTRTR